MIEYNADGQRIRVAGKRKMRQFGDLRAPTKSEREWVRKMAGKTKIPKGAYRYKNHQEANADWERWLVQAMVEKQGQ